MKIVLLIFKIIILKIKFFFQKNTSKKSTTQPNQPVNKLIHDPKHLLHLIRKHEKDQWIIIEKTLLNTLIDQYKASNKSFN